MKIGFIGLGNVGEKLAGSLLRNGYDLTVRNDEQGVAQNLIENGASWAEYGKDMAEACDEVIPRR
jgi:3-hydroxyisobutyrate dehydrogenase